MEEELLHGIGEAHAGEGGHSNLPNVHVPGTALRCPWLRHSSSTCNSAQRVPHRRPVHVGTPVARHSHVRQFYWSQLPLRVHVPTCHLSLHPHRDRLDSSGIAWLRLLLEGTGVWET